jgi:amidohydrolase
LNAQGLKERAWDMIDRAGAQTAALAEDIFHHPELGFKEERTAGIAAAELERLGLTVRRGLAGTGVAATLRCAAPGPRVALLGELDAVVCPAHPAADPASGAAHACGHHAQVAAVLAAARGLIESGAAAGLAGEVLFMLAPAEEYVEIEYRDGLRSRGAIQFLGGKQELIRRGEFAGVTCAVIPHLSAQPPGKKASMGGTTNGFIGKLVRFAGEEAHAGAEPHRGVNALNAALMAMLGVHVLRETFRDEDHVRVHPIITRGGDVVNVVPADVRLETYVRAATMEAAVTANRRVNRALRGGAAAVGAEVEICDLPGYLPRRLAPALDAVVRGNLAALLGADAVGDGEHGAGSTDVGDLSCILPVSHPMVGGVEGRCHARDFRVTDARLAYTVPAQLLAGTAIDLLHGAGALALEVRRAYGRTLSRDEYVRLWHDLLAAATAGEPAGGSR